MMKRAGFAMTLLCASAGAASAQMIDIWTSIPPTFTIELPCPVFAYSCTINCNYTFRLVHEVRKNGALVYSETVDYVNPASPTQFARNHNLDRMRAAVGDVFVFTSTGTILVKPYTGQTDTDSVTGTCVNDIRAPRSGRDLTASAPADAIDERRRFETMLIG